MKNSKRRKGGRKKRRTPIARKSMPRTKKGKQKIKPSLSLQPTSPKLMTLAKFQFHRVPKPREEKYRTEFGYHPTFRLLMSKDGVALVEQEKEKEATKLQRKGEEGQRWKKWMTRSA
jgi:hypothetical protein